MNKTRKGLKRFWNFRPAVKNEAGFTEAEILLYGYIVSYKWWDEDDDITAKEFDEELKELGDVDIINIRINSGGGDVFQAQAIYSMLKRHSAIKHVYVDGWAASAASLVAMAGDKIIMSPGSMMMIHNPATVAWGDRNDMLDTADILDKVRDSMISVYKTKTSKTEDEIKEMMDKETWMTAKKAIELGFVDEIEGENSIETVQNGEVVVINGVEHDLSHYKNVPKFKAIKHNFTIAASVNKSKINTKKEVKIMDLKELKEKHPEIYDAVFNEGIKAERERIKSIEDLAIPGHEEIINEAKYESGITAEKLAVDLIKAEKKKGTDFLDQRDQDVQESNVNDVKGAAAPLKDEAKEVKEEDIVNKIAEGGNRRRDK